LAVLGLDVTDVGTTSESAVDYPDFAAPVARKVSSGEFPRGILICGSGAGMGIVANKLPGVRAVLCLNEEMARLCRLHNDTNILILAGRLTDADLAGKIIDVWLNTPFEGGRHQRRLDKIRELEGAICGSGLQSKG
ncbi:MAG: ribose 5-phosphate isomerase B, partial [Syntrophales bacterium]|nr:ribose 5-phosphate isomerase B [Syntrophales bacterium]